MSDNSIEGIPKASSSDPLALTSDPQTSSSDPQASSSDPLAASGDPQASSSNPQSSSSDPLASSSDLQTSLIDPLSTNLPSTESKDDSETISRRTRSKFIMERANLPKKDLKPSVELTNIVWTDMEKLNLFEALNTYGADSKRTFSCLKSKSENQIRQFLRTRQRIARIQKQKRINRVAKEKQQKGEGGGKDSTTPLEEWIQYFLEKIKFDKDQPQISPHLSYQLLPTVFLILSLFEAHPDPQDCGGVNFKEVYEFLFTSCRGNPTKWLQKPTADFLFAAFYDACKSYRATAAKDESYYLNIVSNCAKEMDEESAPDKPQKIRTYPGKRKRQPAEVKIDKSKGVPEYVSKLLRTDSINPLRLPVDYLEIPTDKSKD